jgi:hypothetical protein
MLSNDLREILGKNMFNVALIYFLDIFKLLKIITVCIKR